MGKLKLLINLCQNLCLALDTHLFVKIPQPVESEVTFSVFKLSCHLLLPV